MDNLNRTLANYFNAGPADRLANRRCQQDWLSSALQDQESCFVPLWRHRNLLYVGEDTLQAFLLGRQDLPKQLDIAREAVLLGEFNGKASFAIELDGDEDTLQKWLPEGVEARDLRLVSSLLDPQQAALLAYARAMLYWHQRHRFCGECGHPTRSDEAGFVRICTHQACATKHFPRTDPAIIVLIADEDGSHCLLGRQAVWPEAMYSCLAGFVEPGESLEHAVVREVYEESGIEILKTRYRSSQSWPFPCSIMLGFSALARHSAVTLHDHELEDARWFTRTAMVEAINDGTLKVSRPISIAYRLIEEWFDAGSDMALAEVVRRSRQQARKSA